MRPLSSLLHFWSGLAILFFAGPLLWMIDRAASGRWSLGQLFLGFAIWAVAIAATAQLFASAKTLRRVRQLSSAAKNARPVSDFGRFVTNAGRSGLVNQIAFADIVRRHQAAACLAELAEDLIAQNLLTRWQCSKLQTGKWKGYFFDGYKLVDFLEADDEHFNYYLVECVASAERLVARFKHQSGKYVNPEIVGPYHGRPEIAP